MQWSCLCGMNTEFCLFFKQSSPYIPLQNWTEINGGTVNKLGENIDPGNDFALLNLTALTKLEPGSLVDTKGILIVINGTNPSFPFFSTVK